MPSEAEWEYAATNGSDEDTYPWGDESATCAYAVMDDGGDGCGTDHTWEVCSKTAGNTSHGLCDMAGNVREWLEDTWHDNYSGAPEDGTAWISGGDGELVLRGGGWFLGNSITLHASRRSQSDQASRNVNLGFRCARSSD